MGCGLHNSKEVILSPLLIIYLIGIPLSIVALTIIGEVGIGQINENFKIPVYKVEYFKVFIASILWPLTLMVCIGLFVVALHKNMKRGE